MPSGLTNARVAVLYGGLSEERSVSLRSGAAVLEALRRLSIPSVGIDVSSDIAFDLRRKRVGLAFLAVHGTMGEDGRLQGILDVMGVPYTGSGVRASAAAMHKPTAKTLMRAAGVKVPESWNVERDGVPAFDRGPWIVKPASQGSAVGVSVVRSRREWPSAVRRASAVDDEIVVERYIPGRELTVGFLGERALPVVEIVPKHAFYDYFSKYAKGGSRHVVPADLPKSVSRRVTETCRAAADALGCRHVSRVDVRLDRRGVPYVLEVNTLPGMTETSLLPDAARAAGISFDDLVLEILTMAWRDRVPRPRRS